MTVARWVTRLATPARLAVLPRANAEMPRQPTPPLLRPARVQEVNRVSEVVTSLADPSANVIFGAVIDDQVRACVCVCVCGGGGSS